MISEFKKQYFFLSNFYNRSVKYNGVRFRSSECAFQAQKCPERMGEFTDIPPNEGKSLGRKVPLRKDWDRVKDNIMYEIVKEKFTQHEDLKRRLLETGDEELQEGNDWYDTYWGVDIHTGKGLNMLGKILMRIRDELRKDDD